MGLFDKARNKQGGEKSEDTDSTLDRPLSEAVEGSAPDAGRAEDAVAAVQEGNADGDGAGSPAVGEEGDPLDEHRDEGDENQQGGDGDDLLELFASEEEEDVDLSALTESLEELGNL